MIPAIDSKAMPEGEVLERAAAFDPTTVAPEKVYRLALEKILQQCEAEARLRPLGMSAITLIQRTAQTALGAKGAT